MLDVYEGPNGLLQGGKQSRPWLFIDSSTIDPQTSRKVSEAVSDCSMEDKKGTASNTYLNVFVSRSR